MASVQRSIPEENTTVPFEGTVITAPKETRIEAPRETISTVVTEVKEAVTTEPPVTLFDVPLTEELQLHIIKTSEEKGISPAIVFAMAYRESRYRTDAVGDGGASLGLLQIQSRWHTARMERLDCLDLLDPYQNVIVGVDYLAEQLDRYGDLAKALTAYNAGHYKGTITNYAKSVMTKAEELEETMYVLYR
jgi:soluble lytic murein transglycosylase-like protein